MTEEIKCVFKKAIARLLIQRTSGMKRIMVMLVSTVKHLVIMMRRLICIMSWAMHS